MTDSTFITRVSLKNYKSIAACDVQLGALTFLVGPNASGKSNFVDALRFVVDALNTDLDDAIRQRNGINEIRCRTGHRDEPVSIRFEFRTQTGVHGSYKVTLVSLPRNDFRVEHEECRVLLPGKTDSSDYYSVRRGELVTSLKYGTSTSPKTLALRNISGNNLFTHLYSSLINCGFYNIAPDVIREPQAITPVTTMNRNGSNIASVIRHLHHSKPVMQRIEAYLSHIAPGIESVTVRDLGPFGILAFRQRLVGAMRSTTFYAASMSDGTLRALGTLVALFQSDDKPSWRSQLVGLEEPESGIHPGGAGILWDAMVETAENKQVLVTSHSPDLLDRSEVDPTTVLAVSMESGSTVIGPVDRASLDVLRKRLFTVGELLRLNQLQPEVTPDENPLNGRKPGTTSTAEAVRESGLDYRTHDASGDA